MSKLLSDRLYWPGGKLKALTLSYDDGIWQDAKLISILDQYNLKATFNLNPGLFGEKGEIGDDQNKVNHFKFAKSEVLRTYKGYEIAAHGMFHTNTAGMDTARCIYEIAESRIHLEKLVENPVTGYAYAFGNCNEDMKVAARACGIRYARTVHSTYNLEIPQDFLEWNPSCHHDEEQLLGLTENFLSESPNRSLAGPAKLFYVWGHTYEFEQKENWERIEQFANIVGNREDVWYAENGEIERYVSAYHNLIFSMDSSTVMNPSAMSVYIGSAGRYECIEIRPGETRKLLPPMNL